MLIPPIIEAGCNCLFVNVERLFLHVCLWVVVGIGLRIVVLIARIPRVLRGQ